MLDHVSSQPAVALPLPAMLQLCRRCRSVEEIAVDAAHAVYTTLGPAVFLKKYQNIGAVFFFPFF
jgi:hypothetical protein